MRNSGGKNSRYILKIIQFSVATMVACSGFLQNDLANSQTVSKFPTPAPPREIKKNTQVGPQVGKANQIVNRVTGTIRDNHRQLSNNDPVFGLEQISAAANSHGEILLNDNSKILVGPGSTVSLDDFVIADNGIKSATVNVLKGAFRFVSGKSRTANFKIKTPLATIGIRGTLFDVYVKENGQTDVILFSGRVRVCTLSNQCRNIRRSCDIVRVAPGRSIRYKNFLRSGNKAVEDREYNLVSDQQRFQKSWQAPLGSCYQRAAVKIRDENDQEGEPSDSGGGKGKGDNR